MKYFKILSLLLIFSFLIFSCSNEEEINPSADIVDTTGTDSTDGGGGDGGSDEGSGGGSATVADNEIDAEKMLALVNQLRADGCTCGDRIMPPVDPLTWDGDLEEAAYLHAKDMDDNNYFSHDSQDGRKFTDRIKATGYRYSTAGENIASGYRDEDAVFKGWKDSPGHCRNMMNGKFTELGAGKSSTRWVQVFGKPR